jgi:hypothetical protein
VLEIQKKGENSTSRKNQILSHEIEPNPAKDRAMHEGDNPSFEVNLEFFFIY